MIRLGGGKAFIWGGSVGGESYSNEGYMISTGQSCSLTLAMGTSTTVLTVSSLTAHRQTAMHEL